MTPIAGVKLSTTIVLEGREAIERQVPFLEELATRCGQQGATNRLLFFLQAETPRTRFPLLVLIRRPQATGSSLTLTNICGAVLLFEYRILGIRTGAYATYDAAGGGAVIALPGENTAIAAMAINAVMQRGAHVALVSYAGGTGRRRRPERLLERKNLLWAQREHVLEDALPLKETFADTLAQLGKSTRFNLRYYRKRLVQRIPVELIEDARGMVSERELLAFNKGARHPVSVAETRHRLAVLASLPGAYLLGLRGPEGKWLSLIAGWREGAQTFLLWQWNAVAGHEKDSLCTVMRSFYLEHEVQRGTRKLVVYGGTRHSMSHSFVPELVTDLIVRRRSVRASLLRLLARLVVTPEAAEIQKNFLLPTLGHKTLHWQRVPAARPAVLRPGSAVRLEKLTANREAAGKLPMEYAGSD